MTCKSFEQSENDENFPGYAMLLLVFTVDASPRLKLGFNTEQLSCRVRTVGLEFGTLFAELTRASKFWFGLSSWHIGRGSESILENW